MRIHRFVSAKVPVCLVVFASLGIAGLLPAQLAAQASSALPTPRIHGAIDESLRVTLAGNTRPEARAANDLGAVEDSLPLEHMQLLLKRSPATQQALDAYTESLSDETSPNYHHWLTAEQFGSRFGVAQADIDTVTAWLRGHGFTVNTVYPNHILIDISGTAAQVRSAFSTEIHRYQVDGKIHIANSTDPRIPAALAPVVSGIVSLHDFRPRPMSKARPSFTFGSGSEWYAVTPADLATIYNFTPAFTAGYTGAGQTIVVVEDTNVYSTADWTRFRSAFGLSGYTSGSFTQIHPAPASGTNNCSNPGINGDDGEAILDAEYASAAAPNAAIELASCADTVSTFGGLIAIQNLLNESATPPAVMSMSYGECEVYNGAVANLAYSTTFQQAVTEGVSVFVSSGDENAASCDANQEFATHGIGVSGFTSTPYNVSVGGTDFADTYLNDNAAYWSATNTASYGSALSYIPEIPWNDSCASVLVAEYEGVTPTYGASGFCNTATGEDFLGVTGGSGGPSNCATGNPSLPGIVSGTCAGWPRPTWQVSVGQPSNKVRNIPDVSLFASNGMWSHYYPYCDSDTNNGGGSCASTPDTWSGAGGTSFSSPIWAGIQALVNEKSGTRWGNPNPVYYKIAIYENGLTGSPSCNSSLGARAASTCVFYDVTLGDMDANCTGTYNCYLDGGSNGVLSTSDSSYIPAYKAGTAWDFATGLGTVNVYNLIMNRFW
jgi:subtilase family serine protease